MKNKSKKNVDLNCHPVSEMKSTGGPLVNTQWVTNSRVTVEEDIPFRGTVCTNLVNMFVIDNRLWGSLGSVG